MSHVLKRGRRGKQKLGVLMNYDAQHIYTRYTNNETNDYGIIHNCANIIFPKSATRIWMEIGMIQVSLPRIPILAIGLRVKGQLGFHKDWCDPEEPPTHSHLGDQITERSAGLALLLVLELAALFICTQEEVLRSTSIASARLTLDITRERSPPALSLLGLACMKET
ncbi:hypothetical protein M5K25_007694 [Dendrobium thyrsiflorum]|uniref:Uncharacterized protein n=1 Tax=Dendrobium thyrsiflorum TaxID=117978 RepID=A0ABD0VET6_DENTH